MSEETITTLKTGAKTSASYRYDLIPISAMIRLAKRFEHGLERYGKNNWQKGLADTEYVIERIDHVIDHCLRLIGKIDGQIPEDGEDDAGAIIWGGAFLCEFMERRSRSKNCSACGGDGLVHLGSAGGGAPTDQPCPACRGSGKKA